MYVCLFCLCVCAVLFMSFGNDNCLGLVCILYLLCRRLVFCIWECSRGQFPDRARNETHLKDCSQTNTSQTSSQREFSKTSLKESYQRQFSLIHCSKRVLRESSQWKWSKWDLKQRSQTKFSERSQRECSSSPFPIPLNLSISFMCICHSSPAASNALVIDSCLV